MAKTLKKVYCENKNKMLFSGDGVLVDKFENKLIIYPPNKEGKKYLVSKNIKSIKTSVFWGVTYLRIVKLSKNLEKIGTKSFKLAQKIKFFFTD